MRVHLTTSANQILSGEMRRFFLYLKPWACWKRKHTTTVACREVTTQFIRQFSSPPDFLSIFEKQRVFIVRKTCKFDDDKLVLAILSFFRCLVYPCECYCTPACLHHDLSFYDCEKHSKNVLVLYSSVTCI